MAERYSGGTPHRAAPGASRFGFRPPSDTSRIPCPASVASRSESPSAPISGGALPQTKALLETSIRSQKPCPTRTPPSSPRTSGIPGTCAQGRAGPSRIATPKKSTCPCPPRAGSTTPKSYSTPSPSRPQAVPCPAQSPRIPKSYGARAISHVQGYDTPKRPLQEIQKICPSTSRQISGLRTPGYSGLRPPSSRPLHSRVLCPSSSRTPITSKAVAIPYPSKPTACAQFSEDESVESEESPATTVAIVQEVKHKLERKEKEERENVLANLQEMQHFRREFILNSLPPSPPSPPYNPLTRGGNYPGYTGQYAHYVTDEMLQGRYSQFKRSGTKEEYYSNAESEDDLDKIEPEFEIEEITEEEELEEFLEGDESLQGVTACPMQQQREETYSEDLFRIMRNGKTD